MAETFCISKLRDREVAGFVILFLTLLSGCDQKQPEKTNKPETVSSAAANAKQQNLTEEEVFANLKQQAETGDAQAQSDLGQMYEDGKVTPFNGVKAFEWFKKSADQGHASGQAGLGYMYARGDGVPKDAGKAVEWFKKSADQGHADGQAGLGWMYAMRNDYPKALVWLQKSADQGHPKGQLWLGDMYADGDGVPKDAARAVEWFQRSAAQGDKGGQDRLAKMYWEGEGVPKNVVLAYAWANLVAANPYWPKWDRDSYEARLTPDQRAEGQRLASSWKKGDIFQAQGGASPTLTSPVENMRKQATGTAFMVSNEGHALTNHHVINGCVEVKVNGREGPVKVLASDSVNDLALIQLTGNASDISRIHPDPEILRQGEDITVFGYPLQSALSSGGNITPGIISALTGLGNNTNQIQITASIQPGSSGSPVMNKSGDVVGVVSMKLSDSKMLKATGEIGQNVNFAVNGQTVKTFLDINKVPYKTGGGFFSRKKSNAHIAAEAQKWTVVLECWK